jgi:hypothetical protein
MAATTLPPAGGDDGGATPLPCTVVLEPSLGALLVIPDHEYGVIELTLAGWRRAICVIGPETALHMASDRDRRSG